MLLVLLTGLGSLMALGFAFYLNKGIMSKSEGTDEMVEIAANVRAGANAYLSRQYKMVGIFVIIMVGILSFMASKGFLTWFVPFAFTSGVFFSGLAGFIGMKTATNSNARTAWAAKESLNKGLRVAFSSGTVMGMVVVGLGLLDLCIWYLILSKYYGTDSAGIRQITGTMLTFGMGASTMALFARVGGGIFTKAADVGADLVGKVEAGIPEDDARNPATIADNVGDNVGDVAGMGADLYESYVGSIVATMALGAAAYTQFDAALSSIVVPMLMATIGVICSIIGTFFVQTKENATQKELLSALRKGVYGSTALITVASYFLVKFTVGEHIVYHVGGFPIYGVWLSLMIGLIAGNVIGYFTEYYTSDHYSPTKSVSEQASTGSATVIIAGLAVGMQSTAIPVFTVVIATLTAFLAAGGVFSGAENQIALGLYGIGIAAVGMLSTLGITLATDAYGPVADNAGGCAEMAHLDPEVRERTDALDSLGNTTAATGKGFAIGSAALTALALLAAYSDEVKVAAERLGIEYTMDLSILNPKILAGLFLGGMLPFLFSSMTMKAVGRAAGKMVDEVRRQFREIKGIMDGSGKPDYASCVTISTKAAQTEMIMPSIVAICFPIATGLVGGPEMVCALLAGATVSGFVLAVMMANAGGAWDNAKKYIESGQHGGKGSDAHKATVVGDTVGDPFKDTSGPSLNILIKLMSMVSLVFAALVVSKHLF